MRVSHILLKFNWKYAAVEVILIVVGVTIALVASSWYEGRQLLRDENALLTEIRTTLIEDIEGVMDEYAIMRQVDADINVIVSRLESGDFHSDDITLRKLMPSLERFVVVTVRTGPFETLKDRGLDLVSNQSLRASLTSLYEDVIPRLKENSEIDQRLSRARILPYFLEYFELDGEDYWIPKGGEGTGLRSSGITLGRYRSKTLIQHFLPSFETTIRLMRETLSKIDHELF